MKIFEVVSVFVVCLSVASAQAQGYSEDQKRQILKNRQECIDETKVDPALILRADQGDFSEDERLKCFTKCFYGKAGFVGEQGEVNRDVIKAKIPQEALEQVLELVEKCQQKGEDACDTVYRIHKCYFRYTHPEIVQQDAKTNTEEEKKA